MNAAIFAELADDSFAYLRNFGFEKDVRTVESFPCEVRYRSATTVVGLLYNNLGLEVEFSVYPTPSVSGLPEDFNATFLRVTMHGIVSSLNFNATAASLPRHTLTADANDTIENVIARYAANLEAYGRDFLEGNFSRFKSTLLAQNRHNSQVRLGPAQAHFPTDQAAAVWIMSYFSGIDN